MWLCGGVSFIKIGNNLVCEDSFTITEASITENSAMVLSLKSIEVSDGLSMIVLLELIEEFDSLKKYII